MVSKLLCHSMEYSTSYVVPYYYTRYSNVRVYLGEMSYDQYVRRRFIELGL